MKGATAITRAFRGAPKSEAVRKQAAEALRLKYQEFFEFAPDCQLLTDSHGVIVEANHAAAALLDCRKEFLIDKPLGLFVVTGAVYVFTRAFRD